jgi:hypothetical protein
MCSLSNFTKEGGRNKSKHKNNYKREGRIKRE